MLKQYEETGALPLRGLEPNESVAKDVAVAYNSRDVDALQRINDYRPQRTIALEQLRAGVRERPGMPGSENEDNLALADAQLLVARAHGFDGWAELVKFVEE